MLSEYVIKSEFNAATGCHSHPSDLRPMALRPCLSTGLPLYIVLPDVDDTLSTGTGICFDYAALTTAMLRSQDIPCKLQIGYSGDVKHAWIDVYIRGRGWVTKAVSFDGDTWKLMDPTFDANSDGDEAIQEYIGDESNYTVQFTR